MSAFIPPEVGTDRGFTIVALGPGYEQLDETHLDQVKESLISAVEKADPPQVIIDLSHTKFFGSSFIEVLFRLWNRMHTKPGGKFAIVGLSPPVNAPLVSPAVAEPAGDSSASTATSSPLKLDSLIATPTAAASNTPDQSAPQNGASTSSTSAPPKSAPVTVPVAMESLDNVFQSALDLDLLS